MLERILKIATVLGMIALTSVAATAQAMSPQVFEAPLRVFTLDAELSPDSGIMLNDWREHYYSAGRYLCAELPANQAALFRPSAGSNEGYVKLQFASNGSSYVNTKPLSSSSDDGDLFVRLPGDASVICRFMPNSETKSKISVGVLGRRQGEYVWEKYEDALKNWARKAAVEPQRPEDPPSVVPSSIADRLWFMSLWLKKAALALGVDDASAREKVLRNAAMWEVLRIRPLDGWAYGIRDLSEDIGNDCFSLEEGSQQENTYCRRQGLGKIRVEGPAVLLFRYRPEIRLEPTPVLEDGLLQIFRDRRLLFSDSVPFYPDYLEFDANAPWRVEAELRKTPGGAVLGRSGSIRVVVPPGSHEFEFQHGEKYAWWSLAHAVHLTHLEDSCNEKLKIRSGNLGSEAFAMLVSAEANYRLGLCAEAEKKWSKLRSKFPMDAEIDYIIDFRLSSCRVEGELLTPGDLSLVFARLGVEAPASDMRWEDRRDEIFRMNQLENAILAYSHSSPGLNLEDVVLRGDASSAQKIALSSLWHLDGVWEELEPPSYMFSSGMSLFQDRSSYPDMDAVPGGISLQRLGSSAVWTKSRMAPGAMRSTTIITSGDAYPARTIMRFGSRKFVLNDARPLESHRIVSDDETEVARISGVRDVWLQQRVQDEKEIADAKLVKVYQCSGEKELYFEMPPEAYSGYAMIQVFPEVSSRNPRSLKAVIGSAGREEVFGFNFISGKTVAMPVLENASVRLAAPLSAQFRLDSSDSALALRIEGAGDDVYYVRVLLRMPRLPEGVSERSALAVSVRKETQTQLAARTASIAEISARLNSGVDEKEASYYHFERAQKLCKMGRAGLAREDLLASGKSAGMDAVLREALIELRELLNSGACNIPSGIDSSAFPLPLDAGVESDDCENSELKRMKREFVALSDLEEEGLARRFDLCSRMIAIDETEAACIPWYMEKVAKRLLEGHELPPSFFQMLIRFSAWQEKMRWPGAEKTLALLWELSHWESISSVESMDGLETVSTSAEFELQKHAGEYADVVTALSADGKSPDPWLMFEGQSLMLHLPVNAAANAGLELECKSLNPSLHNGNEACGVEVFVDGLKFKVFEQSPSSEHLTTMLNLSSGDHMLEIRHAVKHSIASTVLSARVFSDSALPGIPSLPLEGKHYLLDEARLTFMRGSRTYPVTFRILGPSVLRVDSWNRRGALSDVQVELAGPEGSSTYFARNITGRQEIWLDDIGEYSVTIRPRHDDHALLKLYFREENSFIENDIRQLRSSRMAQPTLARIESIEPGGSQWIGDSGIYEERKSFIGTGSMLLGYRRLLRDETGYVEPVDQFFLARLGYSRRVEGADLWLGISSEGRMRLEENDSIAFDGRLYWISPGPQIHLDLQNRFAIQDVSTGVAGGNMLELVVKRPFEILPHWDITPLVSGYYKWQGINDWREDQIKPYTDADVYSPYHRDHPYALTLGAGTVYTPFVNNSFFASIKMQSNSDFASIDNVQVRVGDLFAFGGFQGSIFYDVRPRFADDDRDDFNLRQQLHVGAQYSWWPHPVARLAPTASYDFYPHAVRHAFFGGLLLELSPRRGLRDAPPGEESFPWQVDPERYWVREW